MRAFLAVAVRPPAVDAVAGLLDSLRADVPDVRWVRPVGVHLTLRFFGIVDDSWAYDALDAVAPAVASIQRFDVVLGGLGRFPENGRPRVLWLGVHDGAGPLGRLAETCATALETSGIAREDRPFHPHCTLGRPRGTGPHVQRAWARQECPPLPAFTVDRVTLFESHGGPGGAVYTPRAEAPLG